MNQKYINFVLATLIVVALGVAVFVKRDVIIENLSGQTNFDELAIDGEFVFLADTNARTNNSVMRAVTLRIPSTVNDVAWENDTGHDIWVPWSNCSVPSGSTASSSMYCSTLATTTQAIGSQFNLNSSGLTIAQAGDNFMIHAVPIATGTAATTTNSISRERIDTSGHGSLLVPNGSFLHAYIQAQNNNTCVQTGQCGGATSSDRGILEFSFMYFSTSTSATTTPHI